MFRRILLTGSYFVFVFFITLKTGYSDNEGTDNNPPPMIGKNTTSSPEALHEQTDEEKLLNLDKRLNGLIQKFDDMLLIEKDILSKKKNAAASEFGEYADGENSGEYSDRNFEGSSQTSGEESGEYSSNESKQRSTSQTAGGKASGKGAPSGVPDGNDDDVVARQLREAAETETDPKLKKKLWQEYRKYKEGNG